MSRSQLLSIVIPLHCEATHLRASLEAIREHLDKLEISTEFVLIDDGSTDKTWQVICSLADEWGQIHAARFSRNFGKEAAMSAGLELARGDAVIVMDGDLQHPPELIPEMVRLWRDQGVEVVDAVKKKRGTESLPRRFGAHLFTLSMRRLSGFDVAGASDFKLLDRKVVNAWLQMEEKQLYYRGMVEWLGFTHERVTFDVADRAAGTSAWSIWGLCRFALTALTSFSSLPLHAVTFLGTSILVLAITLGGWTVIRWLLGTAVTGFTTVILLQLIIGSILMVALGIIGQYMSHIYAEVKKRPRYVLRERILGDVEDQQPAVPFKKAG